MNENRFNVEYCYEMALEKIKEKYPDVTRDCFSTEYTVGYWNDDEAYINPKASWEYPGAWYPGLVAYTDEKMINRLVEEGLEKLSKNEL